MTFRRFIEMKNIFVSVLCVSMLSVSMIFASSSQVTELQKKIEALKVEDSEVSLQLSKVTKLYTESNKKIQLDRKELRKGKFITNRYDKTDVDKETADLIDKCMEAEKQYAELKKALDEHLANSKAGIAKAEKYDKAIANFKKEKDSLSDVIKKRAELLQQKKKITDELSAAGKELLMLTKKIEVQNI